MGGAPLAPGSDVPKISRNVQGETRMERHSRPAEDPPAEQDTADFAAPAGPSGTLPAIIGLALAGIGILALGLWLGTRERVPAVPALTLVTPAAGEAVDRPLVLVFDVSPTRLRIGPGGWGVGTLHIHAWIDEREFMPAAADIEYIGSPARYRWVIDGVEPGERTARVGWSDAQHRPVAAGMSDTVRFTVR
jgi:hypothetical protein